MDFDLTPYFKRYEALLSLADQLFEKVSQQYPECMRCKIGCSDCCHALFDLTLIEALYINHKFSERFTGAEKEASTLVTEMRKRFDDITAKAEGAESRPNVFFELDATDPSKPYTPGPGSFIDALISLAGGSNVGAGAKMQWAQLSTEEIIAQDPEVIVLGDVNYGVTIEMVKERPGWSVITAVKNGDIYPIDDILISRPGPRIIDGLEALARIIHPELSE